MNKLDEGFFFFFFGKYPYKITKGGGHRPLSPSQFA